MQTTLLGLAIATILALVAALVAPLVVDWSHYRTAFESEATRLTGLNVRVTGPIDARILPTPLVTLRNVEIGAAGRTPQLRATTLELELGLGPLLRGQLQASEAHLVAPQITLGLDRSGAIDWPALSPALRPDELSISRLSVEDGSIVLADAASGAHSVLRRLSFDGDVRSLAGPFKGEGSFVVGNETYAYRIAGGQADTGNGLKIRLGVDPSNQPLTTDFDGTLTLDHGTPQFDGTFALARPVGVALSNGQRVMNDPWHANGAIQATPASAMLHDVAFQYGPDERAINFAGSANLTFGEHPHFTSTLKALAVDVDRALAAPDVTRRPPLLLVKDFAETFLASAALPLPGELAVGIDGLTVGGTTLQSLHGTARFDGTGWSLDGFELRAPGLTSVSLSGRLAQTAQGIAFTGPAALESADADTLLAWLGGRGGAPSGQTGTLSARGDVTLAGDRVAIERLAATLDRESVEGSASYIWPQADRPAVVDADLHATKLDIDALASFAKAAVDSAGFELPHAGSLALDVGKATFAGVDARAIKTEVKFDSGAMQIERLSVGALAGATFNISGRIDELSSQPRGQVTIDLETGALDGVADIIGRFTPQAADVFRRAAGQLAPAKLHGILTVERAATAGSSAKLDLTGQLGLLRVALNGAASGEQAHLGAANVRIDSRLDADDGTALAALLGVDRVVGVDQLPGTLTLSADGPLNGDVRIDSQLSTSGVNAAVRGALHLSNETSPTGTFQVLASAADLRPLQQAMTGQPGAAVPISARAAVAVTGADVALTQISVAAGKASVRGRLTVNLASPLGIDGDIEADNADAGRVAATLLGLSGQAPVAAALWSSQPVGAGAFSAVNGAVTFRLDQAALTPALTASALNGVARFRPSEIAFENIDGSLAGGHLAGQLMFHRNADGLVSHGQIALADADAAALLQTDKKSVAARLTLKLDGDSIGANPAALVGNAHGSGTIGLADAHFAGLDTAAFGAAMHAADQSPALDASKIQAAVRIALANGSVVVPQASAVATISGGKIGIANVTLQTQDGSALALTGALDLNTATVDARMTLSEAPPTSGLISLRPELGIALKGPLAAPQRTLDLAALSGWLALRAAELQTRRLESIAANGRKDVIGRAIRSDFAPIRMVPRGTVVESGILANMPAPPTLGARNVERLQPELPAVTDPATAGPIKPKPATPPQPAVPPRTAGPDKRSPFDFLFRPQN